MTLLKAALARAAGYVAPNTFETAPKQCACGAAIETWQTRCAVCVAAELSGVVIPHSAQWLAEDAATTWNADDAMARITAHANAARARNQANAAQVAEWAATDDDAADLVLPAHACPRCHERRVDQLLADGDVITCYSCGNVYALPAPPAHATCDGAATCADCALADTPACSEYQAYLTAAGRAEKLATIEGILSDTQHRRSRPNPVFFVECSDLCYKGI